ncbi:ATP-binding protein [Flavobacterium sp. '19STA2R22 D10 B1']|uniref:tetratricopeptide repeat-containing sensor histidine kinase n=1 Tax=Flavobacterium aerium TaxID=3037261 RepID=UPI00278BC0AE|nr:ATP-binding protein [Flavobacterium sp. '19STA2R22 D10 B1']
MNSICYGISLSNPVTDSLSYYVAKKEYANALNYSRKQADMYLKNKQYAQYCDISIRKSNIYKQFNDTENSIKILFSALGIAEKHKLKEHQIMICRELSMRYTDIIDLSKTKAYLYKAQKIAHSINDKKLISLIDQSLFKLHTRIESDSAFYYMEKVMKYNKEFGDDLAKATSYNNYFAYYSNNNEHQIAKKYLDTSIVYALKTKDNEIIANRLNNLAYYYITVDKNFKKGEQEYLKILKLFPNDSTYNSKIDIYYNLAFAYENMNDFKKANEYLNKYIDFNDDLYNNRIKNALRDIEARYEINKREEEYKKKEQLLHEKQIRTKKIIFIFIAILAFSIILYYFFYQNLKLKQKNKLIEIDRDIQQNIINANIDGQEIERKKIAEFLHDSISASLSSASLHLSAYEASYLKKPSEEIKKTKAIIKDAHDKVRDLSHELIPTLLSKFGLYHAIQDLCEKNSNSMLYFECINYLKRNTRYHSEFEMKIYFILAELLNNIIKHSEATEAFVTLDEMDEELIIQIEDNGKGFDSHKTETTAGFGLTQIRARIKNLNGIMTIDSKINKGTKIYIKLKIS